MENEKMPGWAQDLEQRVDALLEKQKPKKEPEKKQTEADKVDKSIADWSGTTDKKKPGRPSSIDEDIKSWTESKSK